MTTTAFYSDPHPETTTVDGYVGRDGVNEVWASIHGGSGNAGADGTGTLLVNLIARSAPDTNKWASLFRGIVLFDTSGIGSDNTPSAATLNVYVTGITDTFGLSLDVVGVSPAANTSLSSGDYGEFDTTLLGTIAISSLVNNAYNAITLNGAGLAAIATTGITKLGLVLSADRTNTEPTWSGGGGTILTFRSADHTGTGSDPYLEVTYAQNAASGQGLLEVTPVAPAAAFGAVVLQQELDIRAPAISAPIVADALAQAVEITPLTPGVQRPWTSGEAMPLELTALAPTATFTAAAGIGLVEVSAPQMVALEAAGLSEVGRLDFTPVAATSTKAAASGPGLIDVTPLAAAPSKAALHEWGRVWLAQPEANASFSAGLSPAALALAGPALAVTKGVAAGVGLVDLAGVVMAGAHAADLTPDSWLLTPGSPATTKGAAADVGLIDVSYVAATSAHAADLTPDSWLLTPGSPATTKSVTGLEVGLVDWTAVAATGAHAAMLSPAAMNLAGPAPNTTKAAGLDVGQIDVWYVTPLASHASSLTPALVELLGVAAETPKLAGDLAVASVELVGIAAARPYRKYAKTATLVRASTTSTLIRRGRINH
jgi:hypothetical protein